MDSRIVNDINAGSHSDYDCFKQNKEKARRTEEGRGEREKRETESFVDA